MTMLTSIDSTLGRYLQLVWDRGASDLHLTAGYPPVVRVDGMLMPIEGEPKLLPPDVARMIRSLFTEDHWRHYLEHKQLDFSFSWQGTGRFRGNAYQQRGAPALALRGIPFSIRTLEELNAPAGVHQLLQQPYGLVLCVGPTGSGKSTTLAAMVDRINEQRACHILTIEDPIEYLHRHKRSLVNQREVGEDTPSFSEGLRAALREDPDVILVGEMRDLESIGITLSLAETGHLVFATLHTNDASQALDRLIDVFPADRRDQIQIQLAGSLMGIISQRLLHAVGGGRVAAYEVLAANDAIRNLIREGKTRQIRNVIATNRIEGMQTLEHDLNRLVAAGRITYETAMKVATFPKEVVARGPNPQLLATLESGQSIQAAFASNGGKLPPPAPKR
ncbi:MAG: type IV pilus twitching motility protein PilT [Ilumatobacteraceae bacterium]